MRSLRAFCLFEFSVPGQAFILYLRHLSLRLFSVFSTLNDLLLRPPFWSLSIHNLKKLSMFVDLVQLNASKRAICKKTAHDWVFGGRNAVIGLSQA